MNIEITYMDYSYQDWAFNGNLKGNEDYSELLQRADSIVLGTIILSTGKSLSVCDIKDLWNMSFEDEIETNTLYLYCLEWVGTLLSAFKANSDLKYLLNAEAYIIGFIRHVGDDYSKFKLPSSTDHSYFSRVCVLTKALMVFPQDWHLKRKVCDFLLRHGEWMSDDRNHAKNNHGVMTDYGLLHLSVLLKALDEVNQWGSIAFDRLVKLIESSFDEDGVNDENTIGYHLYNIKLYKEILFFTQHYHLERQYQQQLTQITDVVKKAEEAIAFLVWQDGNIPPIGDSPVFHSKIVSINKSKFFKSANVAIVKNDDLYFSIKCGWTSAAHKHADETSITLRYRGVNLIVDSGSYNYDRADPVRQYMESCRGHSGIFPTFLEKDFSKSYMKKFSYAKIEEFKEDSDGASLICKYSLNNQYLHVKRVVTVLTNQIQLTDSWLAKEPQNMRQRFVLAPGAVLEKSIDRSKYARLLQFNVEGITLKFETISNDDLSTIINNNGWYSAKARTKTETLLVDSIVNDTIEGQLSCTITFS